MPKMFFAVNVRAGKKAIVPVLADVLSIFNSAGYEVTVYITQKAKELPSVIEKEAPFYDAVVCSGGDGTLNECVTGLLRCEKRPALGFLPAGTTNDVVTNLGLPKKITDAAKVIAAGYTQPMDVGKMNDRYFDYIAAFGNFIEASFATPREAKNAVGGFAYLFNFIRLLPTAKPIRVHAEFDGGVFDDNIIVGMASNGKVMAGIPLGKQIDASVNDGLTELIFIKTLKDMVSFQELLEDFAAGEVGENEAFFWRRVKNVKIQSELALPWTLDGEYGGTHKKVEITNIPSAIKIFVPEPRN